MEAGRATERASTLVALTNTGGSSPAKTRAPMSPATSITVNRSDAPGPVVTAAATHRATSPLAMHRTSRGVEPGGMILHPSGPDTTRLAAANAPPAATANPAAGPGFGQAITAMPADPKQQ